MNEKNFLTKADRDFYAAICKILENKQISKQARPVYKDGSQANSFYITGYFNHFDLSNNEFPITTLRPIPWKSAIKEMLWIYQDQSNELSVLNEKYNVKYWNDWEVGNTGTIGERYGAIVKKHKIIDKILKQLEDNPWNRRNVISLWDYEAFEETEGLLPCAFQTMFDVRTIDDEIFLDCTLVQRSNDMLVAHHINAIQYVALQMMIACHFGWKVGHFNYLVNNLHIYDNQLNQVEELLKRYDSLENKHLEALKENITDKIFGEYDNVNAFVDKVEYLNELIESEVKKDLSNFNKEILPHLKLNCPKKTNFYDIKFDDFELVNYNPIKPQLIFDDLAI